MAYLRPNLFERLVLNRIARRLGIGGTATLVVPGRRSGRPQKVAVIPFEYDGARYVLSTRGEANRVRNLRAAGKAELQHGRATESVQGTEVPLAERPPIIAAYRQKTRKITGTYFDKLPDAADHPVFRLEPAS